jgi:predicted aspartyl protease
MCLAGSGLSFPRKAWSNLHANALQSSQSEAALKSAYENHQWFKLRELVKTRRASAFYRGAVAYAFNRVSETEQNLKSVIDSAPEPNQASDAREMLINLYLRTGNYREALSETERELALKPEDANLKNAAALLTALGQSPKLQVVSNQVSRVHYRQKDGNLFVPVEFGKRRANYIVDTGANFSLISQTEAKRLGLTLLDSSGHNIEGSSGAKVEFSVAIADELKVGDFQLRNVPFLVVPDDQQPFVELQAGERCILGLPVILSFKTLRWKQDGTFEIGFPSSGYRPGSSSLAFDGLEPLVEGNFQSTKIILFLDTGAIRTRVLPLFAREFSSFVNRNGEKDSDRVTGVGGSIEVASLKLPALTFGIGGFKATLRPAQVLLKETTSDSRWWHAWVGMDLLNQARVVTIDFPGMRLLLE